MNWYVRGILLALLLSLVGISIIITATTPSEAPQIIRWMFFVTLFLGSWSFLTLIFYIFHRMASESTFLRSLFFGFLVSVIGAILLLVKRLFF